MKNTLIITNTNDALVSSIDDGTNTLFINDTEIPSSNWVGTGNYTTTVEGHSITIAKIPDLSGNVMIQKVSDYNYKLVSKANLIPVYQDENGNVTLVGYVQADKVIINNDNATLQFIGDTSGYTGSYIRAIDKNANGSVMLIRPGASLLLGGGEYASNRYNVDTSINDENTYIGADGTVYIESNGNAISNRKTWAFDPNGNITTPSGGLINGVDPSKPEYKAGDSVNLNMICIGHVTNSTRRLDFFIPLPKSCINRTATLQLNQSNGLSVRSGQGYLNGTQYIDVSGSTYTITTTCRDNGISVGIASTSVYTNISNNNVVSATINGKVTFS